MKFRTILLTTLCAAGLSAQTPSAPAPARSLPNLPEDTVVAVFDDGTPFTMKDLRGVFSALPEQLQQNALSNPKDFIRQWGMMRKLSLMATQEKLDQESPAKEQIEYARLTILSSAELNRRVGAVTVDSAEVVAAYDQQKDSYRQVKVQAIYIAFGDGAAGGKKLLTEAEAKAKATRLLAAIRKGEDFAKLVKENSDDETSRDKGGDFATLSPSDNIPEAIRKAVFALKEGEVTEPVRQASGYYLLRAAGIKLRALSEVRDDIFTNLRQQKVKSWMDEINRISQPSFPNPKVFDSK
jgi:peptidyl-prolyl cis-trans isomerase C